MLTSEDQELIEEEKKFYSEISDYINDILDNSFIEPIKDYELTIYSILYRIDELLDVLCVMTENSLINAGFLVLRSLLELTVQLEYILINEESREKRAIILQLFDIKRSFKDSSIFYERISKYPIYERYINVFIDQENAHFSNWYSYCEEKKISLSKLFDIVGWKQIYNNLYQPLCIEAHQINHMETNIVPQHHKMNFKPFRTFENHILILDSRLSIMKLSLHRIITIYGEEQHKKNWNIYENKLDSYLTNNHALAQIEKLLNPCIKYFGTNINQSESTCGTGKV